MQITQMPLLSFIGQAEAQFAIPLFQRAYSWEAEQCDELWRDLMRAQRAGRTHFMGTLIFFEDATGTFQIVDGQQRLTTISLMIAALAKRMDELGESFFGLHGVEIAQQYLLADNAPKLSLSYADKTTYDAVLEGKPCTNHPSAQVVENFNRFKARMREDDFDAMQLWQGLEALTVIVAKLDKSAEAPTVFESFNSKGVPLVTADLVRNHLLLAQSHSEQTRLYDTYWSSIQGVFGDDPGSIKLNNAILGWLAVRLSQVRKFGSDRAFSIFKSFCEDEYEGTIDDLLEELYAFCMVWAENYRYHSVKKYKSSDWSKIGRKTRVSDRPRTPLDNPESYEYYTRHFGVDPQW